MSTLDSLEKLWKRAPSQNVLLKDIDNAIASYGDLSELYEIDVIITSLKNIFLIAEKSYLFDPEFGLGLYKYIFEPADGETLNMLRGDIDRVLKRYEDRANITYEIYPFSDRKGYRIDFKVEYNGKNKATSLNVTEELLKTIQ